MRHRPIGRANGTPNKKPVSEAKDSGSVRGERFAEIRSSCWCCNDEATAPIFVPFSKRICYRFVDFSPHSTRWHIERQKHAAHIPHSPSSCAFPSSILSVARSRYDTC